MSELERPPELLRDVAEEVFVEAVRFDNAVHYLQNVGKSYLTRPWWNLLTDFIADVEPPDACGQIGQEKLVTKNVLRGTLLGLRVTELAAGTDFLDEVALSVARIHTEALEAGASAPDYQKHHVLQKFKDTARLAIDSGDPNMLVALRWENSLCYDISTQSFVVDAFAVVLHAAHRSNTFRVQTGMHRLADSIQDNTIDWDAAIAELEAN